jgi:hypothetical protein
MALKNLSDECLTLRCPNKMSRMKKYISLSMVKTTNLRLVTDPHKKSRYDAKESCEFISLQSQSISESRKKSFHDKETKSLIF